MVNVLYIIQILLFPLLKEREWDARNVLTLSSSSPIFCITLSKRNRTNRISELFITTGSQGKKVLLFSHVSRVVTLANVLHSLKPFKAAPLRSSPPHNQKANMCYSTHTHTKKIDHHLRTQQYHVFTKIYCLKLLPVGRQCNEQSNW